ncbi:MAG: adenylate/guanylate cyclase domain-containing protein, partial [Stackebrandtia sp.]
VGDTWAVGMLRGVSAYAACELGELDDADALARKAFRDFDRIDDDWGRGFTLVVRASIARDLGELDHAIELVAESEEFGQRLGHPLLTGMAQTLYGYCLLGAGDAVGAEAAAKTTLSLAMPHEVLEPVKVGPLALLAEARAAQGDSASALQWLGEIAEHTETPALLYSRRRAVARYAQLLLAEGRGAEARTWALRAMDAPGEDAHSGELVARVCREVGVSEGGVDQPIPAMS